MRRTKIVCTLGPSTIHKDILRQLMLEGMNVARINFSHGNHEIHKKTIEQVKALREELGLPIALLLDTKGPEIRIGLLEKEEITLKTGSIFTLTTKSIIGNQDKVSISYPGLVKDVPIGARILLDDGLIELEVTQKTETDLICLVKNEGSLKSNKGVNVPNVPLNLPFISESDEKDIIFGIEQGVDFIAASFTRSAEDILQIRKLLSRFKCHTINLIAKIENKQGIEQIDEIIRVSDGIMIARGDLGAELPIEDIPVLQKSIIQKVYNAQKQVITATQMLDSMMKNPRPTRAEVTDVANAIYDGTSAIMLSGETAAGKYPLEALKTMVKITKRTEAAIDYKNQFRNRTSNETIDITNAIAHATCTTAMDLDASAIITVTKSGKTPQMISKYRPDCPIIGCSTYEGICRQLNLSWGIKPLLIGEEQNTDILIEHAAEAARLAGYVKSGEISVITAGVPLGIAGTTNLIKVHVIGHTLLRGRGIIAKSVCASLCVCQTEDTIKNTFKPGDILVLPRTTNQMIDILKQAAGLIVEEDGMNSHAAIVSLSLDIPVILGAKDAIHILKSGAIVTLDGEKGLVSCNENYSSSTIR